MDPGFDLAGGGQEKQIGDRHAVNRGDERDRDSAPDFLDILQVFHHLDQTHYRSYDPDGRRVSARGLEYLRVGFGMLLGLVEFHFHHCPEFLQIGPVHCQGKRFGEEGIYNLVEVLFERDDAALARFGGVADFFDCDLQVNRFLKNTFFKLFAA
jgi:hypothetical protein